MSTSSDRGEIGAPDDIQELGDGGPRNEDTRRRDVSNETERTNPKVDATISDGASG